MPIIVGIATYPSHKQAEFIKKFVSIQGKYDMSPLEEKSMGAAKTVENGIRVMNLWEVKKGKLEEALEIVSKIYYEFINIEGLESTIDVWYTGNEAFAIAGIKVPG